MIISNKMGESFSLTILGYQYLHRTGDLWDDNWLMVRLTVTDQSGTWNMIDPCMTTEELHQLRDWLQKLMDSNYQTIECGFVESTIKLQLFDTSSKKKMLRVSISPNLSNNVDHGDTYNIEVPLTDIPFTEILDSLNRDLDKFPYRAS